MKITKAELEEAHKSLIEKRAAWAKRAVDEFSIGVRMNPETDLQELISDLICDLGHLAAKHHLEIVDIASNALSHYEAEVQMDDLEEGAVIKEVEHIRAIKAEEAEAKKHGLPPGWRRHFRADAGKWENICPHGIGHTAKESIKQPVDGIHGCDGCCSKVPQPKGKRPLPMGIRVEKKRTK